MEWRVARLVAVLAVAACAGADPATGPSASTPAAPTRTSLRIVPVDRQAATTTLLIGTTAALHFQALATQDDGREIDVTSEATWSALGRHVLDVTGPGVLATTGIGGRATVAAALSGLSASVPIVVELTGAVFLDGTDARAPASFAGAVDAAAPLAIEYPASGVVAPANLAPLVVQWRSSSADTLFRVQVTSGEVLALDLFTTRRELAFPADVWWKIGASAPDEPIQLEIDGVDAAGRRHASAPGTITITEERIAQGKVYAHDCASGGLDVLDMVRATRERLLTDEAWHTTSRIGHCPGCHNVSRDGRRISFVTMDNAVPGAPLQMGTLAWDEAHGLYAPAVVNGGHAPSVAFNPREAAGTPAMISAFAIASQAAGLYLADPRTGTPVPDNASLSAMLAAVPASAGQGASFPAWSIDGHLAFVAWPTGGAYVQAAQSVPSGSIVEGTLTPHGDGFTFGPSPDVIVAAAPGESNSRPSYDDDGALAFMRVRVETAGAAPVGTTLFYHRSDRRVTSADAARADALGVWDARLPDWGPPGSRYAWIAVASVRPYGHLVPAPTSQIWVFAVDRARLASGAGDPSAPAFWLPGQKLDEAYTHPQWPRAVPPHASADERIVAP
jgi:hypothetical protein